MWNAGRVFVGSGAAYPNGLMRRFSMASKHFEDIEMVRIMTLGETPWCSPKLAGKLRVNSFSSDLAHVRRPMTDLPIIPPVLFSKCRFFFVSVVCLWTCPS